MPFLFLSPSTQAGNPYVTEGNERLWMNRIADRMEPYLRASGINVTRNDPEGTVGTSIRASNAGNYDFHLALHSNAAPPQSAGTVRGIDLYYYPGSTDGLRMANILADNLREIYPLPQRVRPLASTEQSALPGIAVYRMKDGESLWDIGKRYYVSIETLMQTNNLTSQEVRPGEKILIVK